MISEYSSYIVDGSLGIAIYMDVFINDRTKTFHRKNPYFNILHLISIIMGGYMPKFQGT